MTSCTFRKLTEPLCKTRSVIRLSFSDIKCGNNAGIKSVLVKITLSDEEINNLKKEVKSLNFVAGNFLEACKFIAADFTEENS